MTEIESSAYTAFEAELHEVERTLAATADELGGPLGELVRGQVMRARPSVRGALVLAVAMTEQSPTGRGEAPPAQRQARMKLAAALEMLYIALNIHRLLVDAVADSAPVTGAAQDDAQAAEPGSGQEDEQLDRTFVGSTILAGDYCFSRAAQLAAHTDNPAVVALFAQALQTISESRLRQLFAGSQGMDAQAHAKQPGDTAALLESGARAAAALVDMDAAQREQAIQLAHEVASLLVPGAMPAPSTHFPDAGLQTRRRLLLHWLAAQTGNSRH